jgi:ABC-type transporter Mla subunit MlaD
MRYNILAIVKILNALNRIASVFNRSDSALINAIANLVKIKNKVSSVLRRFKQ